jgi:hypothetical protein
MFLHESAAWDAHHAMFGGCIDPPAATKLLVDARPTYDGRNTLDAREAFDE